jgi:carboxypeptidase Taq
MKASSIRSLFGELRTRLVPLVKAITERPAADDSCLKHDISAQRQLALGAELIREFGFDFSRGRQDLTHHPFMTKFSLGDVRITTRVRANDLSDCLFSTFHECGHALYELGIRQDLEGTPLATGTSAGVHESQSRLWENLVGRSLGYWKHAYPRIREAFPEALKDVPLETFYAAINKVERTLIRTDSDEVTYNLHVMLRFDLELDMLEGKLAVADLADAWRSRFRQDIGIAVPDDRNGVLQDVHWFSGPIGGVFQGYTLGNVLSAQFFDAAVRARPEIPGDIEAGRFAGLHGWLRENVYQHGSKFTADEIVRRATGQPMSIEPYMAYLWRKYQPLYDIQGSPQPIGA